MFTEDDLIHSYTRAQALADGLLVDASRLAAEAGFRIPLAMTDTVWNDCVAWPEDAPSGWGQSTEGRLWDFVWMAAQAARRGRSWGRSRISFELFRVPVTGGRARRVVLDLDVGPGDNGEPVATVLFAGED